MKPFLSKFYLVCALALSALAGNAAPLGTAFTYQGRLTDGTNAANNLYDLDFALFDVSAGGSQLGMSMTFIGYPVSNGLFTVALDFGASPFNGDARWLQIQVRTNGGRITPWTPLTPRQALTPAPYALYAPSAGSAVTASNVAPLSVTAGSIADGTITAGKLANGQVVKSLNGLFDTVTLSAGTNVTLTPSGNDLKISATPGTVVTNAGWGISGNSGTTAANFLGTLDGQPLELRVNGQRALRLEPDLLGAPNVVGGSVSNLVATGVRGATISGGGNSQGAANRIEANYGSIGGGGANSIQSNAADATIAGGYGNTIQSSSHISTVGGGSGNLIQANTPFSTIGGGVQNTIQPNATNSIIGGGYGNTVQSNARSSAIGGGEQNSIQTNASFSTLAGGSFNTIKQGAFVSSIGGGTYNTIEADASVSTIGGGSQNTIWPGAWESTIGGGKFNTVQSNAFRGTIGGGEANGIFGGASDSTIGGGFGNQIHVGAAFSTIGGGYGHTIGVNGTNVTIGGGYGNTIQYSASDSTIGGGYENTIQYSASDSTIGGGVWNQIRDGARTSTIGGGGHNFIWPDAEGSTIAGGEGNHIYNLQACSAIGGGTYNIVGGSYATIPGGIGNYAHGDYSLAAGHSAQAEHRGAFVWADDSSQDEYWSSGNNQFCVRAAGGVQLSPTTSLYCGSQVRQMLNLYSTNYGIGVQTSTLYFRTDGGLPDNGFAWYRGGSHRDGYLDAGGGATLMVLNWGGLTVNGTLVSSSDRNQKENFAAVSPREVLDKVTALPISRWNFKGDSATPHVGPMAQDFHAAFALGTDDKHIATVDADGVALAAIQGLNQKLEETRSELKRREADNAELKTRLERLEQLLVVRNGGGR